MRRSRFSEEQIITILNEALAKEKTIGEICREHGISQATFYKWRQKYGGLGVSEAKRLRELELENARLKRIVAEKELGLQIMREVNAKKW